MKFMLTFTLQPATRNEAIARFLKTGGQPPKGAKLLGRWTSTDLSKGYDLLETDDPSSMTELALQWTDLMEMNIVPVVEDKELGDVLKGPAIRRSSKRPKFPTGESKFAPTSFNTREKSFGSTTAGCFLLLPS